jgi:nucleoside-diphosphate-sugar epimerase
MMPQVLITGATGFIGSACLRHTLVGRAEIHALSRHVPAHASRQCTFHHADLFDSATVDDLMGSLRPSHLLHLAWTTTPGQYWRSAANRYWLSASLHLLRQFAAAGGKRAVLVGSCAEYSWQPGGVCHELRTPLQPASEYGRCKNELCQQAEALCREAGIELAWARLFFVYGPGEQPARLIPTVVQGLLAGRPVDCTSGVQERDFLHVDDVADALWRLLFSTWTGTVNVASGEPVSIRTLVEQVGEMLGRADLLRFGARPMPADEPPLLVADVERLQQALAWKPSIGLGPGIADVIAWWQERQQRANPGSR